MTTVDGLQFRDDEPARHPGTRTELIAAIGRLAGYLVVGAGVALAVKASSVFPGFSLHHGEDLAIVIIAGTPTVTLGLLLFAVCERIKPGPSNAQVRLVLIFLGCGILASQIWSAQWLVRNAEDERSWIVVTSLTTTVPLAPTILLLLTSTAATGDRLLGRPSRAATAIGLATVIALAFLVVDVYSTMRNTGFSGLEADIFRGTAVPFALAVLLILASSDRPASRDALANRLARATALVLLAGMVLVAINETEGSDVFSSFFWFLLLPSSVVVLLADTGRVEASARRAVETGSAVLVWCGIAALAIVLGDGPSQLYAFNLGGGQVVAAMSDSVVWTVLGTLSIPIAFAALQILMGLGRRAAAQDALSTRGPHEPESGLPPTEVAAPQGDVEPASTDAWARPDRRGY